MSKITKIFVSAAMAVCLCQLPVPSVWATSSSMYDFVIFSGGQLAIDGGYETDIGGHTLINGNIGTNQDLFMQGNPLTGYPAQLNGSAYAGRNLTLGQDLTVGSSSGPLREVVANNTLSIDGGANVYGNVYGKDVTLRLNTGIRKVGGVGGNVQWTTSYSPDGSVVEGLVSSPSTKTFGLISMPAATSFSAGGINQTVPGGSGSSLTLASGTYGTLATSAQNQTVNLSSGNYYFDAITAQGGFTLDIDLTSGNPVNLYVVGDVGLGAQNMQLKVKGVGTGGTFVPISSAPGLASLIYMETHGLFDMGGSNIWGGTVYASLGNVNIGQYINWTGAAYAYDTVTVADHGTWNYIPVPEPATICLLGLGSLTLLKKRK